VVSMPSGVFKPYAGVSTAVLFFTRGAQTKDTPAPHGFGGVWFYDMAHDGFSLDDKRVALDASRNDIPDVVNCWEKRTNKKFVESRKLRVDELRTLLAPLKDERRKMQAEINRLTFDHAVDSVSNGKSAADLSAAQTRLSNIESQISAPQSELDRLTRQFWVTKEQVASRANKYDLSASRYRQVDADAVYHEKPTVTLERLARLESIMLDEISELKKMMKDE